VKTILLTFVLIFSIPSSDLNKIRVEFKDASKNRANAEAFYELVQSKVYTDDAVYTAYDGASEVILSKYLDSNMEKLKFFKHGSEKIENAITEDGTNVEIRFVRLVIQVNSPAFLNYDKNIDEDKDYLLNHYSECSKSVKKMISEYASLSDSFSIEEKNQLK
jgi:hypothetical protein